MSKKNRVFIDCPSCVKLEDNFELGDYARIKTKVVKAKSKSEKETIHDRVTLVDLNLPHDIIFKIIEKHNPKIEITKVNSEEETLDLIKKVNFDELKACINDFDNNTIQLTIE